MKPIVLSLLISAWALIAQVADKANEGYKTPEGRAQVAKSLIAPDRDAKQKPEELVQAMAIRPGMVVADIGTGAGYMLPFLSHAVGPSGRVVAEDIQDDFLAKARAHAEASKLSNVTFVKGGETRPEASRWRSRYRAGARLLSSLRLSQGNAGGPARRD